MSIGKSKKHVRHYGGDMLLNSKTPFNITEAYKSLRTNLLFALAASNDAELPNVFAISSSLPGEGKSVSSANLAIAMAQMETRVLLIDADLRKPVQNKMFSLSNVRGLSSVLIGETMLDVAIKKDVRPNLDILTSGKIPSNPSELLGSSVMLKLLKELSGMYDYIIVDTPPLNIVTDALTFAAHTAGVLLAVCPTICKHEHLRRSTESANLANVHLLGCFLSNTKNSSIGLSYNKRYGHYNYYSYYERK